MKFSVYILPLFFIVILGLAAFKKVKMYDSFTEGVKGAIPLTVSIFPYLVTIFIAAELFEASGLTDKISELLAPFFRTVGIPEEISKLVLLKPFSGSGSMALLSDIYAEYGADSYISRCASVVYGSSETIFYIAAVYFAGSKHKRLFKPIAISLVSGVIACIFACLICRIM